MQLSARDGRLLVSNTLEARLDQIVKQVIIESILTANKTALLVAFTPARMNEVILILSILIMEICFVSCDS